MANKKENPEVAATREMIVHMLSIYPVLSPTMLQAGIGPYQKPAHWRPILEELIQNGVVVREQEERKTPKDRHNTYTKLRLADEVYEEIMEQLHADDAA